MCHSLFYKKLHTKNITIFFSLGTQTISVRIFYCWATGLVRSTSTLTMANPFSAAETAARDNAANQLTAQTLLTADISNLEEELNAKRQRLDEHRSVRLCLRSHKAE